MFTTTVREKLAADYGIRDIPHELLTYFVSKYRNRVDVWDAPQPVSSTVAFLIANEWQRGKTVQPI